MALFVLSLVIIDIVILGGYTVTEAVRGNLGVRETFCWGKIEKRF